MYKIDFLYNIIIMDLTPAELSEKYPNYEFSEDCINIKGTTLRLNMPTKISKYMHDNAGRLLSYCEKAYRENDEIIFEFYGFIIRTNFESFWIDGSKGINDYSLTEYLNKYEMVLDFAEITASHYPNYKVCINYDFSLVFVHEKFTVGLYDLSQHVHDTILYTTIFLQKNCEDAYFDKNGSIMKYYFESYSSGELSLTYCIHVDLTGYYIENLKDKSINDITADEIFDYVKLHSPHLFSDTNKSVICE